MTRVLIAAAFIVIGLTPSLAAQTRPVERTAVVKVFLTSANKRMTGGIADLGRQWAKREGSVEIVKREADADLVLTLDSRERGQAASLTLRARFGPRSESLGGDDFGYLVSPSIGDDFGIVQKPDIKLNRLGGDDLGWLVEKVDGWLDKNRARVLAERRLR